MGIQYGYTRGTSNYVPVERQVIIRGWMDVVGGTTTAIVSVHVVVVSSGVSEC